MDQDAGGAEDEERKKKKKGARESSKFSSQLLMGHAAPGTLVKVLRPLQLQHFSWRFCVMQQHTADISCLISA